MFLLKKSPNTYDHRMWRTGLPVRSVVLEPFTGELVFGWVATSELSPFYVFVWRFSYRTLVCLSVLSVGTWTSFFFLFLFFF